VPEISTLIIAPFVITFRLAKCLSALFSTTPRILPFFEVFAPASTMFASSAESMACFVLPPRVLKTSTFGFSEIVVCAGTPPLHARRLSLRLRV